MLIVSGDALLEPANAFGRYRESTGFVVECTSMSQLHEEYHGATLEDSLKRRIKEFYLRSHPSQKLFVVLLGDAEEDDPEHPDFVPIAHGYQNGLGDTPYADIDEDFLPDIPIGRLPFRKANEVEHYLVRLKNHETLAKPGRWDKTVPVFHGIGGFGTELDALFEYVTELLADEFPYQFYAFGNSQEWTASRGLQWSPIDRGNRWPTGP